MAQQTRSRSSGWQRRASQVSFLARTTAITVGFMTVSTPLAFFPIHDASRSICGIALSICSPGTHCCEATSLCFSTLRLCVIVLAPSGLHPAYLSWGRLDIPAASQTSLMLAELSFGCASYLIKRPEGNILVDVPRYVPKLVNRIKVCLRMLRDASAARLSAFIGDLQKGYPGGSLCH